MADRTSKLLSWSGLAAMAGFTSTGGDDPAGDPEQAPEAGSAAAAAAAAGGGAPPPPAPPPPPPPPAASASEAALPETVVAAGDALRLADEARVAEAVRWNAVLTSPEGKANPSTAAFLLFNSVGKADAIIAQLKDAPAAGAGARSLAASVPRIDLGQPAGAARGNQREDDAAARSGAGGGADQGDDPWKAVLGDNVLAAGGGAAARSA